MRITADSISLAQLSVLGGSNDYKKNKNRIGVVKNYTDHNYYYRGSVQ